MNNKASKTKYKCTIQVIQHNHVLSIKHILINKNEYHP